MLATSQKWKDNINRDDRICLGYITLDDTVIQDDLFEYSIDDTIDSEGFIGTFVKKKCTLEVLNKENKYMFDNKKIKVYAGLQYEDNTDEYVFLGTYMVAKASYDNVSYSSKLETYDLSTLFDVRFVNNVEYPCTVRKYVEECCKTVGVQLSADEFNLQNMILEEQPYLPEGATFRDAIKQVAQTCLSCAQIINDELHITTVLKPNTNTLTSSDNQYTIKDGANSDVRKVIVNGKSTQATRSGKNLFNKNSTAKQNGATKEVLDTGVRAKLINSGNYRYFSIELGKSEFLGKTITLTRTITNSASNVGQIALYFGNETSQSKKFIFANKGSGTSNIYIPNTFPEDCDRIWILFYGNVAGTGNVGDYTDYTDLMITVGDTLENYEDYGVSPSPDYPSEIECVKGKNLLLNNLSTITINGVTATVNDDKTVNVDGTNSSTSIITFRINTTLTLSAGTYKLSGCPSGGARTTYRLAVQDSSWNVLATDTGNGNTFTLSSETTVKVSIYIQGSYSSNNLLFKPMISLEKGTVATNYLPYDTIQVKVVGKNLYNDNFKDYTRPLDYLIHPITLEQGQAYTLKATLTGTKITGIAVGIVPTGEKYSDFATRILIAINTAGNTEAKRTITIDETWTSPKLVVYCPASSLQTTFESIFENYEIQLEKSPVVTDYEPYQENTLNIDLQGNELCSLPNNVKDELVIENGRAKIIKNVGKVVLNGSESWTVLNKSYYTQLKNKRSNKVFGDNNLISDYFKQTPQMTSTTVLSVGEMTESYYSSGNLNVFFNYDNGIGGVDNFKTWLSTHNTIVYYQLATEQEIDLGEVENLKTFDGDNNILIDMNMNTETLLEYKSNENVQKIDFELDDYFDLTTEEQIGPYNVLVLGRSPQEDNLYFPMILPDNPYEYRIDNNQIVDKHRELFGPVMLKYIEDLKFIPHEVNLLKGRPDISSLDYFKFIDMENVVKQSIVFTHKFKFDGNFISKISAASKSKTQTSYKRANTLANRMTTTELEVDKAKGEIKAVVSTVQETESTVQSIITTQDSQQLAIEAITEKTSKIDDEGNATSVKTGTGFTFNDAGLNISEIGGDGFNSQFTPIGSYYKDGDEVISMTTKDGSTLTNLNLKGQTKYSYNDTDYDFVDERVDADGEYCYATFYDGEE